ncbi:hypothetical protein [Streptomyces sp. NPDC058657]|uniref:hypothetical protein n=1 Tax=unclassified Streptomyces TaxID=2593676 RepID=UPI0036610567
MQQPKFTKITTDGHPAYRFDIGDRPFEAYRHATGTGAWNVDAIEGDKRRTVVTGKDTRAAAVSDAANAERETRLDQLTEDIAQGNADADELLADMRTVGTELTELQHDVAEWGAAVDELTEQTTPAEPAAVFTVQIERHVQARPRVWEDRYLIFQRGFADPIERFALPYRSDRSDRRTLELRGWTVVDDLDYIAGPNVTRARVERSAVEYGNAGHWISAHVVDPDAGRPDDHRYVARALCGAPLIATYDTPRGHARCVACTGDPVEVDHLRDRVGWLKDGGRPVKVLRALSHYDRIIASVETTDNKPREWHDVRCDATASELILAPENLATREEITAGALVEAVVISNRPTVQRWRVDRAPWGDDRSTILSNGRGVDAVWTGSLRVIESPQPVHEPTPELKCVHGNHTASGVTGDPVAACQHSGGRDTFGVFNAEGCTYADDCAVDVANEAAKQYQDDDDTVWGATCDTHPEEPAATCAECFRE